MPRHMRSEAKEWAKAHWRCVCNIIMPTFTADFQTLNEKAIRHDVRRNIELGFWGALLVSECATSLDEYKRFMEIAVDEASSIGKGRHHFLIQGVFDTPEQVVAMAKAGEAIGVSGILLGQPNSFYPKNEDELYGYLSGVAGKTDLAVCMFCTTQMNFSRFHKKTSAGKMRLAGRVVNRNARPQGCILILLPSNVPATTERGRLARRAAKMAALHRHAWSWPEPCSDAPPARRSTQTPLSISRGLLVSRP